MNEENIKVPVRVLYNLVKYADHTLQFNEAVAWIEETLEEHAATNANMHKILIRKMDSAHWEDFYVHELVYHDKKAIQDIVDHYYGWDRVEDRDFEWVYAKEGIS